MNQSSRNTFYRAGRGCGQIWTPTHRQVCPALGKKFNHCGLLNHFAKVCRKKLNNPKNSQQSKRINNVENSETTGKSESQNVNFINYNEQYNSEYDSSHDNYVAMVEPIISNAITLQNMTIKIGNAYCHLLVDSGSGCTIINMSLAKQIMFNCIQAQWSE